MRRIPDASKKAKKVTVAEMEHRQRMCEAKGFPRTKWADFCIDVMQLGLTARVYEAFTTRSKYVFVSDGGGRVFKVRFSNHRPNGKTQAQNDSDFYVGVSNGLVTTTADALKEVRARFGDIIKEA